jgi:thiamine-phosphate pyrophosphorylase
MADRDKAEEPGRRKLRIAARAVRQHFPPGLPPVLFLTDPARVAAPLDVIAALPRGWGVVYRHFGSAGRRQEGEAIAELCRRRGLFLLVAADPELAMRLNAAGVHWPARRAREARRWATRFDLQTCSAHTPRELRSALALPVSGILFSVVFPSASPSAAKAMGGMRFRQSIMGACRPVYGLGGITAQTAGQIAPVAGLAAIDGVAAVFG